MKKKIAIFIPTYNAAKTLPLVIDRIPNSIKKEVEEIFVADDESKDNTYLVAIGYKKNKKLNNLKIFHHKKNKGYGGNQKWAYQYCINKGYDVVVMLHGDAQYAPEKIPDLIKPFYKNDKNIGMVFGSRMKGDPLKGGMPLYKFIGNKFLTLVENLVLGLNLSEYHSGYRAYDCKNLKKIPFHLCSDDFHFDSEIIVQLRLAGLKILETPIPTYYGEERCHVNVISYGMNVLRAMSEYLLHKSGIRRIKKYSIGK
ncbi:glycosyltransferase family 2 protein [Candidatus Woesearchaeota archaeon]|nr:glycosyltransferase family 2 protein [Candidatus Woesearchaeota archaeon]